MALLLEEKLVKETLQNMRPVTPSFARLPLSLLHNSPMGTNQLF